MVLCWDFLVGVGMLVFLGLLKSVIGKVLLGDLKIMVVGFGLLIFDLDKLFDLFEGFSY